VTSRDLESHLISPHPSHPFLPPFIIHSTRALFLGTVALMASAGAASAASAAVAAAPASAPPTEQVAKVAPEVAVAADMAAAAPVKKEANLATALEAAAAAVSKPRTVSAGDAALAAKGAVANSEAAKLAKTDANYDNPNNGIELPELTDAEYLAAGFRKDARSGLWLSPNKDAKHDLLIPQTPADQAAFTNMLLAQQHEWVAKEHGEHSLPAGISFLVKEYQQLVADTLAILGISQPHVEFDWLAQHVQYKINEFFQMVRHVSPSLANHISITNPIFTDKKTAVFGSSSEPLRDNKGVHFGNNPLVWSRQKRLISVYINKANFSPCLVALSANAISFAPRLISIGPKLIAISTTGAHFDAKLMNIQPTLIKVKATGFQLTPRQFNVNPSLIEVSPTITIKNDRLRVPKTERWGAPVLDFSGKGVTILKGEPMPRKSELPPLPRVPKFNPNALKYTGK